MPTYIMLSNLTEAGAKTVSKKPKRIQEVNSELEKAGVTVDAQYVTLGTYDFVACETVERNESAKCLQHIAGYYTRVQKLIEI